MWQTGIGATLREARNRRKSRPLRGRGRDQDPASLPAGARERGVGRAARRRLHAQLHPHLRRLPRPRRRAARRRATGASTSRTAGRSAAPRHEPACRRRARPDAGRGVAIPVALARLIVDRLPDRGADRGRAPPAEAEARHDSDPSRAGARRRRNSTPAIRPAAEAASGVSVRLAAKAEVWVCLLDANGERLVDGQILEAGAEEGPFRSGSFTVSFGNGEVSMKIDGQAGEHPGDIQPGRVLDRLQRQARTAARKRNGRPASERDGPGRDSRHRDRGPDRADRRPQRALGLRAAGRAGRRGRPHPRRRRPPRRPRGGAALHGRRGDGPDRHLRRARADRRRPHRRGRRPLRRPRAGARRGDGGEDRRDPARLRPPLRLRRGGGAGRQPQAGDGARGGDRARPGRHRARAGRPGRRAAWSSSCPGPPRELQPMWPAALETAPVREVLDAGDAAARLHAADVRRPGVGDRQEPARDRGGRGRRSTRSRSPPACGAARSRSTSATATRRAATAEAVRAGLAERHERHLFSVDGETIDSQVARAAARATGWAWPSPAAAACWRRGSPTCPAPRPTWPAASSPTRTRRRRSCWASTRS